jgi:hypothetical protein
VAVLVHVNPRPLADKLVVQTGGEAMADTFSKRFGLGPQPAELKRGEAPRKMRTALAQLLKDHPVDDVVFIGHALLNAKREVRPTWYDSQLDWQIIQISLVNAEWYEVFDFVEILCRQLHDEPLEVVRGPSLRSVHFLFIRAGRLSLDTMSCLFVLSVQASRLPRDQVAVAFKD